jgi:predicted lipoprotein with Yx(FWY)xxD motif
MRPILTVIAVTALAVSAVACSGTSDGAADRSATTTALTSTETPGTDLAGVPSSTITSSTIVTPGGTAEGGTGDGGTGDGGSSNAPLELRAAASTLGQVVADADGRTLYVYDGSGSTSCPAGCEAEWPPLVGAVVAGPGITAPLGTKSLGNGGQQVTIAGRPLYYYSGDTDPGASSGQGLGGTWFVVNGAGDPVTTR